jgi:hypothetical protein
MRLVDMPKTDSEKLKAELVATKVKGDPHTLKEPIPVTVALDNGETYKGFAFEVRPNGLVMVQAGNCDLGVQLSSITCAASADVAENDL